jgi:hypothetical protein
VSQVIFYDSHLPCLMDTHLTGGPTGVSGCGGTILRMVYCPPKINLMVRHVSVLVN